MERLGATGLDASLSFRSTSRSKITVGPPLENSNTVVTIPADLPLSDPEKAVLSKCLNLVPITKRTDEFAVKQDVEKFLSRVQLKAFFHNKEDNSRASAKEIFETFENLNELPQRPKMPYDNQKRKFNCNTKCSNLSTEERAALRNLSKRKDVIIKPADKSGAVFVWRSDLYQQEAFRQLLCQSGQRPHPNQPKTRQGRSHFKTRITRHGSESDYHNS